MPSIDSIPASTRRCSFTSSATVELRSSTSRLDGETDEVTARRVAAHLEDCRRCGLEAITYRAIKDALARREEPGEDAVERLHEFGQALLRHGAEDGSQDQAPGA